MFDAKRGRGSAILSRPRLLRLLDGPWKIAVLSAPAGYGKSTLATQFIKGRRTVAARVHPEDREAAHLLGTLLAAGMRLRPPIGARTQRLFVSRRDMERDGGLLTGSFLDELIPTRGETIVFLDDVHFLGGARDAGQWLSRVMEESGPRVRFLLTCRGGCPIPLARLDLQGGSRIVRAADLELTEEEQRRLLRSGWGLRLTADEEAHLRRLIGGWAAGLIMSAHQMRRTGRLPSLPASDAKSERSEKLASFLAEEVFAPLPAGLRRSLCRAALLDDLDPAGLRVVLGSREAGHLTREIAHRDLFVRTLPDGVGAPRFHPLFRSHLRARLVDQETPRKRRELLLKVARHWMRRGETARAIRVLIDAGDTDGAVRLLEDAMRRASSSALQASLGEISSVIAETVPDASSPWIRHLNALHARESGHFDDAERHIRAAEEGFLARRTFLQAARSYRMDALTATVTGRLNSAIDRGSRLLERIPARERVARGIVSAQIGNLLLHVGMPSEAKAMIESAILLLGKAAVEHAEASVLLANVAFTQGRWDVFVRLAGAAALVYRRRGYIARLEPLLINTAEAHIYLGEEERGLALLDEARAIHPRTGIGIHVATEAIGRARAHSEMGSFVEAAKMFRTARTHLQRDAPPGIALQLEVWEGVLERRRGRLGKSLSNLTRAVDELTRIEAPSWLALARIERALVLGLRGRTEEAVAGLREAERISRRAGDRKELARIALFEARILQVAGDDFRAVLFRGLRALSRERYLVLLRKEADVALPLLNAMEDSPLRRRALAALPDLVRARIRGRARSAPPARGKRATVRLLGRFEVRVDGRSVVFPRRASEWIISYLALHGGAVAREVLAEAIWPAAPAAASRNRFDVALSAARRSIETDIGPRGPFHILRTDAGICLLDDSLVEVDVEKFDTAARECQPFLEMLAGRPWSARLDLPPEQARRASPRIQDAIALYGGDLLPGLPYAAWVQADRDRLREGYLRLIVARGSIALVLGGAAQAEDAARRVLSTDPLNEDAVRLLLRALAARGEAGSVQRTYRTFARRMERHLGSVPAPETTALVRDLTGAAGLDGVRVRLGDEKTRRAWNRGSAR